MTRLLAMTKVLAIMKNVGYGVRDTGRPCLYFDAYVDSSRATLQVLYGEESDALIKQAQCYNVADLNGKACWVHVAGNIIQFIEFANI